MLFKKVAVLLFVLALYKKRAYDKYVSLQIKKILTQPILVKEQQNVLGSLVGGAGDVDGAGDVEKLNNAPIKTQTEINNDFQRYMSEPDIHNNNPVNNPEYQNLQGNKNQGYLTFEGNNNPEYNNASNPYNTSDYSISTARIRSPTSSTSAAPATTASTLKKAFDKNKYFLSENSITLRNKKAEKLKKEALLINDLKRRISLVSDPFERDRYKIDLDEKQAKIALDMLLFQLSEEKRIYSFEKKQEQMQYIGTLSQLNSKAGTNITKKFINTNKFYDKQEPEEHKISVLKDINNPSKTLIESNKKQIEIAKHEFEFGECLGHDCTIYERISKLTALYNAYIRYFTSANLYGDNNKHNLIYIVLSTNPLNNETIFD
jgi:hypothetical protein